MFTGIIRYQGKIVQRTSSQLTIAVPRMLQKKLRPGGSLAVNGVCLTVEAVGRISPLPSVPLTSPFGHPLPQGRGLEGKNFPLPGVGEDQGEGATNEGKTISQDQKVKISILPETARTTTLGRLPIGELVNLELPLRFGDPLDGHFVLGHVDGVGTVQNVTRRTNSRTMSIAAPRGLTRFLAPKGSVAVDGVSLTIQSARGAVFTVGLIPETIKRTTLGKLRADNLVNIEVDMVARYLQKFLPLRRGGGEGSVSMTSTPSHSPSRGRK